MDRPSAECADRRAFHGFHPQPRAPPHDGFYKTKASPTPLAGGGESLLDHLATLAGALPALLHLLTQGPQRIEVEEERSGLDARAGENSNTGIPVVILVRMCVAFAASSHGIDD